MDTFFIIFGITIILLLLCFGFIGIKILVKKNGEFKRSCSSVDPITGERIFCHCNDKSVHNECKKNKRYNVLDINKEMIDELK